MTKEDLFKKYSIDETHNEWVGLDDWMSIEIYRIMHNGELPPPDDMAVDWVTKFLDKKDDMAWWLKNVMSRDDWGSLFLTAKRIIYKFSEQLIK